MNTELKLEKTPIVTVMGHVDHGKTSLLDKIRDTSVASTEAGGITQSVRAHQVVLNHNGTNRKLTFVDTPGHEAFSKMRSRGAKVGTIALIVVAANEGVKPQTIEACNFALLEKVPMIIVMTKIDLPAVDDNKVYSQLAQNGILVEAMGGETVLVKVSSKTGEGITELINTIFLIQEMNENGESIDVEKPLIAEGLVLESNVDKQLGCIALTILKKGKLDISKLGILYASNDEFSSKIRNVLNADLKESKFLEAGDPAWIVGLPKVLNIGQTVRFFTDEKVAMAEVVSIQEEEKYNVTLNTDPTAAFAAMFASANPSSKDTDKKILNIILRTDTRGSMEVAKAEILKLADEFAEVKLMDSKEGEINESDIRRAKDTKSIIIGFRSQISDKNMRLAIHEKILVRNYNIIYEMIEELEGALLGLTTPEEEEVEVARAKIKQVFQLSNGQYVAGSVIQKGKIIKGYKVFVERNGEEVGRGKITEIKILKNVVKEVDKGKECGILLEPNIELHDGDEIVAYKIEKV